MLMAAELPLELAPDSEILSRMLGPLEGTPAQICAAAASQLTALPLDWRRNGRGPFHFDDLGAVRACVQAATDLADPAGAQGGRILGDILLEPAPAGAAVRHNLNHLAALFADWGLIRVERGLAQPGDLLIYAATGGAAACGIMLVPAANGPDSVVVADTGQPPARRPILPMGGDRAIVAVFTWPES
jgi:hypothetical protein